MVQCDPDHPTAARDVAQGPDVVDALRHASGDRAKRCRPRTPIAGNGGCICALAQCFWAPRIVWRTHSVLLLLRGPRAPLLRLSQGVLRTVQGLWALDGQAQARKQTFIQEQECTLG